MVEYKNYYFKWLPDEKIQAMSGCHLPRPEDGPFRFVNCDIHPRLWNYMRQEYKTSEFVDTYFAETPAHLD